MVERTKTKAASTPPLRPFKGFALMRERGSNAEWFSVEFLIYYERSQIRTFAYVRRADGTEIPDGEYDVREGEDERRRRWTKWDGKWQVKWRHRWSKQS